MATTQPIRNKHQIHQLINYYKQKNQPRNYVLTVICLHTALRISDVLRLTCNDVYDFAKNRPKKSITLTEQKTGKSKTIALHKNIIQALKSYYHLAKPGAPLILNSQTGKAITRVQAYRLLRAAADALSFTQRVSCHSLRKTFGYHAWKRGVSPAIIMEIFNHNSLAVTKRYLGVTQDEMNHVYMDIGFVA